MADDSGTADRGRMRRDLSDLLDVVDRRLAALMSDPHGDPAAIAYLQVLRARTAEQMKRLETQPTDA